MVAENVRIEEVGESESTAAFPDAIRTIIVSPIARPKPSTHAASKPGDDAGSTTRHAVCHVEAPIAIEPSRKVCGTEANASSAIVYTIGITARLSPMPAVT